METQAQKYKKRLKNLYKEIESWLKGSRFKMSFQEINIKEGKIKPYRIQSLTITDDSNNLIAELIPKGSLVVAAEGLADLKGNMGIEDILYLTKNPQTPMEVATDDKKLWGSGNIFGAIADGWYWIEGYSMTPKLLDRGLFLELISRVSDYEFVGTN